MNKDIIVEYERAGGYLIITTARAPDLFVDWVHHHVRWTDMTGKMTRIPMSRVVKVIESA